MLSQTKSNHLDAEIGKGYITLDDTDSLEYDFKVETGKITGSVRAACLILDGTRHRCVMHISQTKT